MNLDQLKLLLEVADSGSISRTALLRGVPPSLVSRQIRALELDCGGRLLDRTGRGVSLTRLGVDARSRIETLLADAAALKDQLEGHHESPRGEVKVGVLPSFSERIAGPLLLALRTQLPHVTLRIYEAPSVQMEEWLAFGRIDVGMVIRKASDRTSDPLSSAVALHLVGPAGDGLTRNATVAFRDISGLPLVLPGTPSAMRPMLDNLAKERQVRLNVILESESLAVQVSLASAGAAHAILGAYAVKQAVVRGRLQASRITHPEIVRTIGLVMSNSRKSSTASREVARLMRKLILDEMKD